MNAVAEALARIIPCVVSTRIRIEPAVPDASRIALRYFRLQFVLQEFVGQDQRADGGAQIPTACCDGLIVSRSDSDWKSARDVSVMIEFSEIGLIKIEQIKNLSTGAKWGLPIFTIGSGLTRAS